MEKVTYYKIFDEADTALILQIPLADESHGDVVFWSSEASGEYLVRSAYKFLQLGTNTNPV